eukprot:scaffold34481_cov29-Attheya_sp.AAC.1
MAQGNCRLSITTTQRTINDTAPASSSSSLSCDFYILNTALSSLEINMEAIKAIPTSSSNSMSTKFMDQYGHAYPTELGLSREGTIWRDPITFYKFVLKGLLEQFQPTKVEQLDKLMKHYKNREEKL